MRQNEGVAAAIQRGATAVPDSCCYWRSVGQPFSGHAALAHIGDSRGTGIQRTETATNACALRRADWCGSVIPVNGSVSQALVHCIWTGRPPEPLGEMGLRAVPFCWICS